MHSTDHILTVCIGLPNSTGAFEDIGTKYVVRVISSLFFLGCKEWDVNVVFYDIEAETRGKRMMASARQSRKWLMRVLMNREADEWL